MADRANDRVQVSALGAYARNEYRHIGATRADCVEFFGVGRPDDDADVADIS